MKQLGISIGLYLNINDKTRWFEVDSPIQVCYIANIPVFVLLMKNGIIFFYEGEETKPDCSYFS